MASKLEKHWLLDYNTITIFKLWNPVRKRVHTSRNIIFNEAELIKNMNVKNFSQNITAPINIITTNMFTENKKDKFIAARTHKIIFKIKLSKKIVRIIKISAKFINIIVSCRNPNIVYENLIKENLILSKIIIIKIISNKDKSSYEIAIASSEIF
jgi:hypothetical protein